MPGDCGVAVTTLEAVALFAPAELVGDNNGMSIFRLVGMGTSFFPVYCSTRVTKNIINTVFTFVVYWIRIQTLFS